jgi:predicted PurR-regulated permease PerM
MNSASPSPLKPLWSLLAGASLAWVVWWHAAILAPFVAALVLAYVLHPLVDRMVRRQVPRAVAVAVCLTGVLLLAAVLIVLLIPIVSELTPRLRDQLPDLLSSLWAQYSPTLVHWGLPVPLSADELKVELLTHIKTHAAQWSGAVWSSVLIGGSGLMSLSAMALLIPVLAFYWLLDWHRLTGRYRELLPMRWRPFVHELMGECDELMGQYLRGQFLVMLLLAAYYSVGLSIAGFQLALPIGVFTGLAICIPYLGFGLGLLLATLAGLLQFETLPQGASHALLSIAVVYGLGQIIEGFFLTPRLVGERIGLHPLGVILALMVFGKWMGFPGVLIALPSAAFLMLLGRHVLQAYRRSAFFLAK